MRRRAVLLTAAVLGACGTPPRQQDPEHEEGPIPVAVEAEIVRIGEDAARAMRTGLSQRLMAAIATGGPESAIDACAAEALPLTDSIAAAAGPGLELKRTSLRIRNPRNAPDALEREALEWFAAHEAEEQRPTSLVQRAGGDYRYYAPLRVAAMCMHCHGAADALSEPVRAALRVRYPEDRATGYSEGELRGLIRVSVPAEAAAQRPREP